MELILNTFGTTLIKKDDNFFVIHNDGKQTIHPSAIKSIQIGKGARISSDAVLLAIENEIDILFVDNMGQPKGRVWSVKYGSVSTIRRKQLDFTLSEKAIDWIKQIIIEKINNQIALLISIIPENYEQEKKFEKITNKLNDYITKIKTKTGETVSDIAPSLRGWEGAASKLYFETIADIIPEEYKFTARSQHPATDIFNALLNYGYGLLYGKIEAALIKAGIDPYVGVMHREDYNRPVLVFDVIEKYRVWIDYVVINLINQKVINEDCYSTKSDGSVWLEGLGKRILIQSVNDYLDEIVNISGVERTRINHIQLYAQKLATMFLNHTEK
jgi:CRISPR-associated protein Cas1